MVQLTTIDSLHQKNSALNPMYKQKWNEAEVAIKKLEAAIANVAKYGMLVGIHYPDPPLPARAEPPRSEAPVPKAPIDEHDGEPNKIALQAPVPAPLPGEATQMPIFPNLPKDANESDANYKLRNDTNQARLQDDWKKAHPAKVIEVAKPAQPIPARPTVPVPAPKAPTPPEKKD